MAERRPAPHQLFRRLVPLRRTAVLLALIPGGRGSAAVIHLVIGSRGGNRLFLAILLAILHAGARLSDTDRAHRKRTADHHQDGDEGQKIAPREDSFARRYPWIQLYTPVNEMFICATFSAGYGWRNEQEASDCAYVTAIKHIVKANVLRVRNNGVPIIGFTWYSLTDQVDWDMALRQCNNRVNPLGVYDLDRNIRDVGRSYRQLIADRRNVLSTQCLCLTVPVVMPGQSSPVHSAIRRELARDVAQSETPRPSTQSS